MSRATARIEIRVPRATKDRIVAAAAIAEMSVSHFVVDAATAKADRIIAEHYGSTTVPADYFDRLFASLDEPDTTSPAIEAAFRSPDGNHRSATNGPT